METDLLLDHPTPQSSDSKKPILILFGIVSLFIINIQMLLNVQPQWLIIHLCRAHISPVDFETCRAIPAVQQTAAMWSFYITVFSSIPSFISQPVLGTLSDRIGRKPMFFLTFGAVAVFCLVYIVVDIFDVGLWILLVAAGIIGSIGGFLNLLTATLCYLSDLTPPASKSSVFMLAEASFLAASAFGPLIGGFIVRNMVGGLLKVYFIAFGVNLVLILTTLFMLPESLKIKAQPSEGSSSRVSVREILHDFKEIASPIVLGLVALLCLQHTSIIVYRTIMFYYVSFVFGWDAQDEGQFLLTGSLSKLFVLLLVFPYLSKKSMSGLYPRTIIHKTAFEWRIVGMAATVMFLSFICYALAKKGSLFYIITVFESLGSLAPPLLRSLISLIVPLDKQGMVFAIVGFLDHLLALVFGGLFSFIWVKTISWMPNLVLFSAALIFLGTLIGLKAINFQSFLDAIPSGLGEAEEVDVNP